MTAVLPPPTPLDGAVRGTATAPGTFVGTYRVDEGESALRGHYPGLPIFPGICLVECVHQAVRLSIPEGAGEPVVAEVESCRFVAPVFPGHTVDIRTSGESVEDGFRCRAVLSRGGERVATLRIRYRLEVAG
ncbi:3-hydroxyacyl-ACP dehydratase FabZ family protein [Streptomyces sp. NBC_00059]|uniref:3-hydroxyacyl-ACP dehydratase FabZ family protein n=1 Tax=Streptomyces sp. NBC_00059 TaxID=2975635 RepID=UPI0022516A16|nr:MaoC/PaaZ C-terminal domain-containing protein [Streptomyces sp. NBC_00059]MCX5415793.1 MaoC/PaaZ C-terminal domain-containing protein [Streptomyces sp. NBC_00059]